MSNKQPRLIDRKTLAELHPALKNRWRVDWLVRTRQVPFLKIGRSIFFNEASISDWIEANELRLKDGLAPRAKKGLGRVGATNDD